MTDATAEWNGRPDVPARESIARRQGTSVALDHTAVGQYGRPVFEPEPAPVTVLGVGNSIMGDDGVGLELLAGLQRRGDVNYVDGGVGGMELVPVVRESTRLLILDAVVGAVPGTVVQLRGDQVSRLLATKLSPHQVGLLDVLAVSRLLGSEPDEVVVVGIVPESVELRLGLSAVVAAAVPAAVAAAEKAIAEWLEQP